MIKTEAKNEHAGSGPMDYFLVNTTLCRRGKGETQQSVAQKLGITRQNVSQYENDERRMSLELACNWARARGYRLVLEPITAQGEGS